MSRQKRKTNVAKAIHYHNKKRFNSEIKNVSATVAPTSDKPLRPFTIGVSRIGGKSTLGGHE